MEKNDMEYNALLKEVAYAVLHKDGDSHYIAADEVLEYLTNDVHEVEHIEVQTWVPQEYEDGTWELTWKCVQILKREDC